MVQILVTNGIKNPPSTYSDMFSISILNQSGNVKFSNDWVSITYTAGTLQSNKYDYLMNVLDVKLTSSSNISGAIANISISFIPGQPIIKDSTITIEFPYFNKNSGGPTNLPLIPDTPATMLVVNSVTNKKIKIIGN
jgi:hypothetical protein